jgi:hypothetical protein
MGLSVLYVHPVYIALYMVRLPRTRYHAGQPEQSP